jgi:polyhydroxyalkanoate synthesis regulator phasin
MGNKFKKNPDVSWQMVEGQAVLIHNRLGEIQVLNEVGSIIWENLEKGSDEIVEAICKEYDVTKEEAKKDVEDFLKELKENQAITEE